MSRFRNIHELKDVWNLIIETIGTDPKLGFKLHKINISQQLVFTDFKQTLSIFASEKKDNENLQYLTWSWNTENPKRKPSTVILFDSSVGNEYLQGKINVMKALMTGKVHIKGKIRMAMSVFDIVSLFSPRYIRMLKNKGYKHLIIR